jgi:glyoxalase family protein
MALEGLHHITAITGDAIRNVDLYAGTLGLRLVKKTVNFDRPTAYHLYYGDEHGTPGSLLRFFEFPGVAAGRNGDGMPYRIAWRVAGDAALDFWSARLGDAGVPLARTSDGVQFADPEGLEHELVVEAVPDAPLRAGRRRRPGRARAARPGAAARARPRPHRGAADADRQPAQRGR